MKITFIADAYYPSKGGVQNVTKYLAEGLAIKNEVNIITLGKDRFKDVEELNNVKIQRFYIKKNKLKKYYGEIQEYIEALLNLKSDFIIFECCETITFNIAIPILKKMYGKKILHAHGCYGRTLKFFSLRENLLKTIGNTYNYLYYKLYYYPLFLKKYINDFDAVISLHSCDSGISYFDKYYNGKKFILENAADDIFFEKNANVNKDLIKKFEKKKYFISVANYRNIKNQIGILKEFKKSKNKDNFTLNFIGEKKTKYYDRLCREVHKLNLENKVNVLTEIDRNDIPGLIENAYLYLTGSTYEEYSISLIETMAKGVPFISTNVGNASKLPGGITITNIRMMANTIDYLVNNTLEYNKLSKLGKEFSRKNCTIIESINKIKKILQEL